MQQLSQDGARARPQTSLICGLLSLTQGWTLTRQSPYLSNPVNSFYTGENFSMAGSSFEVKIVITAEIKGAGVLHWIQEIHKCTDAETQQQIKQVVNESRTL